LDEAIGAYEASQARLSTYVPASLALERVLRGAGQSARLAAMYEIRSGVETEAAAKACALVRAATVYELRMKDTQKALQSLDRAIAVCPGYEPALWARLRIHEVLSDWRACSSDLRALLGIKSHAATRSGLLARAARLHECRLEESTRAAILVEEAMACGTGRKFLIVDRVRTASSAGHSSVAHRWMAEAANNTTDRRWAAAVSRLRLLGMMASGAPVEDIEEACATTLVHRPGDVQALEGLASVLIRRRDLVGVVPVLVRGARQIEHETTRAICLFMAGALAEGNGDRTGAQDIYNDSLRSQADNIAALHGLRRLAIAGSDWRSVVHACERIAEHAVDITNTAEAFLEAGDAYLQRMGTPASAVHMYRSVLQRQPDHVVAFERAVSVVEQEEEWGTLAEMMAAHLASLHDEPRRVEMLQRRAAVLSDRLGRIHEAIAEMDKAVKALPAPQLMTTLAGLYERDSQWQNAVQTWQRLAAIESNPAARAESLLRQATLLSSQLGEYERARSILEPLAAQGHEVTMPREGYMRLAEVYAHLGRSQAARDLYRQLGGAGTPEERVDALLAAATLSDKDLGDHSNTQEALEQAFEIVVHVPGALAAIEAHFQNNGAWQRYVALADRVSDRTPNTAAGKLAVRMSVARTYRSKLRSPELSDMHLRQTVELFPSCTEPRLALGFGLVGSNDQGALNELRAAIQVDPFCQDAYQAIASICHRTGMSGCAAYAATAASLLSDEGAEVAGAGAIEPLANSLIADDALSLLVGPTRTRGLRRIAQVLDGQLHALFPVGQEVTAGLGRVADGFPASIAVRAVAAALGARPVMVYRGGQRALTLLLTETRGLVFGAEQVTGQGIAQGMFEASWILACVAAGSGMLHGLSRSQWLGMLVAAVETTGKDVDVEYRKKVMSILPRRTRKDLERIVQEEEIDVRADYPTWEAEERTRALRAAVAMSRDLRVVARSLAPNAMVAQRPDEKRSLLASHEMLGEALRFSVSEACWTAHLRLFGRK
jgi:tetratricopeptide (TPR) repeat protein